MERSRNQTSYSSVSQQDSKRASAKVYDAQIAGRLKERPSSIPRATGNLIILSLIAIVPIVAISVWGARNVNLPSGWSAFASSPIGGKFTQPEAKAIDLLCGAILTPLVLTALNYFWFQTARVAVINEHNPRALSLRALAVASSTCAGSYDMLSLWQLLKTKAPRLLLLGCLMLAAAISQSALANVIAYEAYKVDGLGGESVQLKYLADDIVAASRSSGITGGLDLYQFSSADQASFANQMTGMLTGISLFDARSLLNGTDYFLINATIASMNQLNPDVLRLEGVPASKQSIECRAETPNLPSVMQQAQTAFTITLVQPDSLYWSYIPGKLETMSDAYNGQYAFAAFNNANQTYLGMAKSLGGTEDSNTTTPTPYGDIGISSVNMSSYGFEGVKQTMDWYGIACWVNSVPGSVVLGRLPGSSWTLSDFTWDESSKTVLSRLFLADMQTMFNYNAPGQAFPGIGTAMYSSAYKSDIPGEMGPQTVDWETFALNFLYVNGETERLLYETAATNNSRSRPEQFYQVQSLRQEQFYRITYVPAILFVAITALVIASSISIGLALYTWRSISGQELRLVDALRLIVDCMNGLQLSDDLMRLKYESNRELDKWAGDFRVRYELQQEDPAAPLVPVLHTVGKS